MQENNKNLLLATAISMAILLSWTWFYEKPKIEKREELKKEAMIKASNYSSENNSSNAKNFIENKAIQQKDNAILSIKDRQQIIKDDKSLRVTIKNQELHGSIYLKGARFDDLTLAKYFEKIDSSKEVILFSPSNSKERYFADFGWLSSSSIDLPNPETIWKSSSATLDQNHSLTLSWRNKQNIDFIIEIALDENFMFFIKQKVKNNSNKEIAIANYGRINRSLPVISKPNYILHEGFLGVFNSVLNEINYKDAIKDGDKSFNSDGSTWLGITDKYWLSAIIADERYNYKSDFSYKQNSLNQNIFNSEFVSQEFLVAANSELVFEHKLFAGAKKVKLIDEYAHKFNIKLFDRAIDFGWFYFLTKPLFFGIDFLYKLLGNFGLAIIAITVIVKAALFPMANKSFKAIARIKKLQPKIDEIRQKNKDDRLALNKEMMEMYKREKVNPASGCLPLLIQIPIFFSLYKVIFVTLDMRHASFYGWIKDLSMPDPTSIFNLFGLLPYHVGGVLAIGVWPILMGITMIAQQKLSPAVSDPIQAKILKFMPYILTVILAAFPAGLVIYWTWSNLLSIAQQYYITKKLSKIH